jgi:putative oxidoreductase
MAYGLLLLRVVVGMSLAAHGTQKLFGWFGGPGPKGTANMFRSLGFPRATEMALLAGLAEAGGLLFALGLLNPLAAFGLAVVMLNAIGSVHWKNGFWNTSGGYEFPLVVLASAVAVATIGPGRFSIDRTIGWDGRISGLWWGVGVLALAIVTSGLTLVSRKLKEPARRESRDRRRAA